MSDRRENGIVIVGAGLAGASAAQTLRDEGYDGPVTIVGAESHHPYLRPPLSKEYLAGSAERASVFVQPEAWYPEHDVELIRGARVMTLDRRARSVQLDDGRTLGYDGLVLATGSTPRQLDLPGADLDGVHYLRTLDQSEALRERIAQGDRRIVVIGSGWIGMEVAATARTLGNDVVVLDRGRVPLAAALGEELGEFFASVHIENGVDLRRSVTVDRIEGSGGRVSAVVLDGGERIAADTVVVGIGANPEIELARAAGLEVGDGVLVDASLRTSDPAVVAAGDIASAMHPVLGQRLRSEHWANALKGGAAAARSLLGQEVSYDDIPYFYTDQFDIGMEYSGFAPLARSAEVVYRGDREDREFIAFWIANGRVVAGMNVNVWDVNESVQRLISRAGVVDTGRLIDPDVPLDDL